MHLLSLSRDLITESRVVEVGRGFFRWCSPTPMLQQGHLRVSCPDPCPGGFGSSHRWTFGNLCGETCARAQSPSQWFPGVQREPCAFQFEAIASGPAAGHCWKTSCGSWYFSGSSVWMTGIGLGQSGVLPGFSTLSGLCAEWVNLLLHSIHTTWRTYTEVYECVHLCKLLKIFLCWNRIKEKKNRMPESS